MIGDFRMRAIDPFKMDKTTFSAVSSFEEADEIDKAYWHSKLPQERLEALELMRQVNYGYNQSHRSQKSWLKK